MEPTVYETSDIESDLEVDKSPKQHKTSNVDVVEADVDFLASFARFNSEYVDGKVNFNYVSNAPLNESGFKVYRDESVEQKLERISKELNELKTQGHEDTRIDEMLAVADGRKLDVNVFQKHLEDIWKVGEKLQLELQNVDGKSAQGLKPSELIDMDKKVAALEAKLGAITTPLHTTLNDFERKINIINNPQYHMESVQKSITGLLESPDYAKLNNSGFIDYYKDDKLQELASHVTDINQYIAESDQLVQRLRALNTVHTSMVDSQAFVAGFESLFSNMATEVTKWEASMAEIAEKLDASTASFDSNKKEIRLWVEDLTAKVDTLKKGH